jgi:ring-1,2-phenylacetyl-CoA epoxidase subunit PaaE
MKQLSLTIINKTEQPNNIVTFELKANARIQFKPGQFISIELIINGKPVRRSYSLLNSPFTNEHLSISVKRVDNGAVSRVLHDNYTIGNTLRAYEPTGLFTYEYNITTPRDIFLIGAGSGITPLLSILKSALLKEPQSNIVLIYSNRTPESTLFYEEIKALEQQYPTQLKCVFLYSNNKDLSFARLNRELLEKLVAQYLQYNKQDALVYNCGPADYMLMCRIVLTGLGFTTDQLKKETFVLPEDEADDDDGTVAEEPDTNTYAVELAFEGKQYHLDVPYPKTILDVGLEQNIDLPYSCKSGMCGTCAALCTNGSVSMRYNEILTDKEIAQGRFLLCTSRPNENNIVVEV